MDENRLQITMWDRLNAYAKSKGVIFHYEYSPKSMRINLIFEYDNVVLQTYINHEDLTDLDEDQIYINIRDYIDYVLDYWFVIQQVTNS